MKDETLLPDDFDFDRFNDVVWLEVIASNPRMHSITASTIAMVALELNRRLGAALQSGNSAQPVTVPAGYVLVPVEPTPEMIEAYRNALYSGEPIVSSTELYKAMLAAAPKAPDGWIPVSERMPMQPLEFDAMGTLRFKENAIVRKMLDYSREHGYGLNEMALEDFTPDDRMQLMQLIGYSLSGYGELSFVSDESYNRAEAAAPKVKP
ncbi:hypothetical protein [Citrobacter sp. RHBSTW-00881]|uniref:hypothetical protein n=1 Tax=Citrobacter sp. RHBSTW-00881 TaxID=2742667 RepID=UPI001C670118|nr:hypothetical protein [Citrobacter sp. RHBSTW-00881]